MSNKQGFRAGIGLAQIMATLLVVLPTLAFMIVILFDYWSVMQADYRIKLVANLASEFAIARDNLRDFSDGKGGLASDYAAFVERANKLCPGNTKLGLDVGVHDAPNKGEVDITIKYIYNGTYLKNQVLQTRIDAYSYTDQNMSVGLICK